MNVDRNCLFGRWGIFLEEMEVLDCSIIFTIAAEVSVLLVAGLTLCYY